MSDERKPVTCSNCKSAMQCVHDGGFHNGPQHYVREAKWAIDYYEEQLRIGFIMAVKVELDQGWEFNC